jgi:hypothetical protein
VLKHAGFNPLPKAPVHGRARRIQVPRQGLPLDSWEAQYGGNLDPNADQEIGAAGTPVSNQGDGYTALEEYRGFFVRNGGTLGHTRTDPVNQKEVFYWDPDGIFNGAILVPQTPFHRYYEITAAVANPRTANPADGVFPHNRNRSGGRDTFAVVYVNRVLGGNCQQAGTVLLGTSGSLFNDGTAIRIDAAQVTACANRFQFPANVLQPQVIAHETGHKFGLGHHVRNAPFAPGQPQQLPAGQYTRDSQLNTRIYSWYDDYLYLGVQEKAEKVYAGALDLVNNMDGDILAQVVLFRQTATSAVYQIDLRNPISTQFNRILVQTQLQRIMDWTPRWTLQQIANWQYDPPNLPAMCIKSSCP